MVELQKDRKGWRKTTATNYPVFGGQGTFPSTKLELNRKLNLRCQIKRVRKRWNKKKHEFLDMTLDIGGKLIRSFLWHDSLDKNPEPIKRGRDYDCQLRLREYKGKIYSDVFRAIESNALVLPERVLNRLPLVEQVDELNEWLRACPSSPLRQFVLDVFSDAKIAEAFFTRPASREHHHSWPGGLAEHSLEVAHGVLRVLPDDEDPKIAWLASCAGLVHDIGKTRTHRTDGKYTPVGYLLGHDLLTLELLAPALKNLERCWPDGAHAMRYLLTLKLRPDHAKRPWIAAGIVLQEQDRFSAARDAARQAFEGHPARHSYARLAVAGPDNHFWRPMDPRF